MDKANSKPRLRCVCGAMLPEQTGRGRPFTFCSVRCRRIVACLNELRKLVFSDGFDRASALILRGELWRLGNELNRAVSSKEAKANHALASLSQTSA